MTTQTREKPNLKFGNLNGDNYPHSERTHALLEKLLVSAHEGTLSLTGAWPVKSGWTHPRDHERNITNTKLKADGTRLPALGNRVLGSAEIIHEYRGRKATPANTTRLSVLARVYNQGSATEIEGMSVSLRKQGDRFDTSVNGQPLSERYYDECPPQAHILGVVAAAQALRDAAAGAGGDLSWENRIDYAEVRGVLHDWETVFPGRLEPLLDSMRENGYDVSQLVTPAELVAQAA